MENHYRRYKYRWVVLVFYMFLLGMSLLYWLNFAAIETYMEKEMLFSSQQVVWLAQIFLIMYVLLTVPSGIFIDKYGFKKGIGLGAVFTGVFALFRLIDPESFTVLFISQLGIAIGQPFILNGITKIVTAWFSAQEEGTAIGLASLSQPLGMVFAFGLTPRLVEYFNFTTMIYVYALLGFTAMLCFLLFVKSSPPSPPRLVYEKTSIPTLSIIKSILKIKNYILLCSIVFLSFACMSGLLTRLERIMHDLHGVAMSEAGNLVALFLIGGTLGQLIVPIISDKIKNRKRLLSLMFVLSFICLLLLLIVDNYTVMLLNGFVFGSCLSAVVPMVFTMSLEITGSEVTGTAIGFLQLLGSLGSALIVPVLEVIRMQTENFIIPLLFVGILLLIALFLSLFMNETYPKISA